MFFNGLFFGFQGDLWFGLGNGVEWGGVHVDTARTGLTTNLGHEATRLFRPILTYAKELRGTTVPAGGGRSVPTSVGTALARAVPVTTTGLEPGLCEPAVTARANESLGPGPFDVRSFAPIWADWA